MLNFGASKPRVRGGPGPRGPPPGSAPDTGVEFGYAGKLFCATNPSSLNLTGEIDYIGITYKLIVNF